MPRLRAVGLSMIVALLAAEGAVRAVGWVLARDRVRSSASANAGVIYAVGDSFTYGQGVAPEQTWPRVLATRLQETFGDAAPAVRTLAEPGRSSSVATLEASKALKAGDARLLLVMTGWNANDGDFAAFAAEQKRRVPWTTRVDLALSYSHLYRVVKQAATFRSRALVLDSVKVIPQTTQMHLYDFQAYQRIGHANLQRIARMCRAAGVPCVLLTYPHQPLPPNPYTRTEYYHAMFGRTPLSEADYLVHDRRPGEIGIDAVIRSVGESEDVPVVDLQPAFERSGRRDLFQSDWHHPTAAGHAIIADVVFDAIRRRVIIR
jgi:lysophospholipase L1-like esterase